MKASRFILASMLLGGFIALPTAGCGARTVTALPDAAASPGASSVLAGTVTVTVIDNTAAVVAGATVALTDSTGKQLQAPVQSGADGTAVFSKVSTGTGYAVIASKDGITAQQTGLGLDSDTPLIVKVMLAPPDASKGTIGGSITDASSHLPLEGATVTVQGTQLTVKTQPDGSYLLKGVPVGNPTIVATMPGYRNNGAPVELGSGALQTLPLTLTPAGDPGRLGHTLVTEADQIIEFDRQGHPLNPIIKRDGYTARPLANDNTLIAGGGQAYIINAANQVVWNYHPLIFGALNAPQGISRASNGNIFIADTGNNRVLEVSQSLKVENTIHASFNHPLSAEREDGTPTTPATTLVADTGNNRVIEVDDKGNIVWGIGAPNLLHPSDARRLPNGDTLITDSGNHRILQIDKAQGVRHMYGGDGTSATCYFPNSAQALPNDDILIADTGNNRVIEVSFANDVKGTIVWHLDNLTSPSFAERL